MHALIVADAAAAGPLASMLEAAGHPAPETVTGLPAAVLRLQAAPPDVVFLDLELVGSNDRATLDELRAAIYGIPVIVLAGPGDPDIAARTAQLGAQDALIKGRFDAELLGRSVRYALECARAAEVLRATEERYRSLFESMVDGFAHCQMIFEDGLPRDFVYLAVNGVFEDLTGLRDVAGRRITDLVPGIREANPELFEIYGRVAVTGRSERFETFVEPLARWFDISVYCPSRGEFVAVFANVTERRRAEDAVRASERLLQAVVDEMPAAVFVKDCEDRFLLVNRAWEGAVGIPRANAVGKTTRDLFGEETAAAYRKLDLVAIGGASSPALEEVLPAIDGPRTYLTSRSTLRGAERQIEGVVGLAVDITDRKRADADLRLRTTALEAAANAILIGDREGTIVWSNPAFSALTGYSRAEAIGMSVEVLKHAESDAFYAARVATLLAGHVWKGGLVNRRKDGSFYDEEMTITPVMTDGVVTHFIALKEDVTERRRAEATRARLAAVLEATTDFVGMADASHQVVYVNRAGRRLTGIGEDESLVGMDITAFHPAWAAERVARRGTAEAIKNGIWSGESALLTRDGQEIPVSQLIISHRTPDGSVQYLSTIMRDISNERRAEEALKQQEERLRLALEGAALGAWHRDIASGLMRWSDRCYSVFGMPVESPLSLEIFFAAIHPNDRAAVRAAQRDALAGAPYDIAFRVVWPDLSEHWLDCKGRAYFDASGKAVSMEGVAREVTEYKRLEEQLRQAQKMEAVGRLAGGVAHDFNNLLGVILGYTELLMRKSDTTASQQAKLAQIVKASEGAASLTRQLLAFSRKQVLEPKVLDLNALVSGAVKLIGRLIGEDIHMVVAPASDLGQVQADPGQLEQVVMNLAVNARDAMPDGGTLSFATANVELLEGANHAYPDEKPGPYVCLTVSDTGRGMDAATLSHIYEPFFTTKEQGKGTGLGLATVYGIVTQSGGHIRVESAPGKGTAFGIYLPRIDTVVAEELAAPAVVGGSATVLLVEDDDPLRDLTRELLEANGYEVLIAANAEDALVLSAEYAGVIDVLLTDVVMPGLNGRALADRVLASRPETRLLFMSGYTDDAISHRGVLDPGTLLLRKPFTEESLTHKLREALEQERAVR